MYLHMYRRPRMRVPLDPWSLAPVAFAENLCLYLPAWNLSGSQLLKCQNWRSNHMTQGVQEQIGTLSAVETEAHLVQVGGQMLSTDFVPCSNDAPLEQRERRLNSVRVNVTFHVHSAAVIDSLVRNVQ